MTSLEQIIRRLSAFWRERGCAWIAPCDLPLPLATMHPRAFFALLTPGSWRAAYAQPIRRPADGRFGQHPFRLARHHQFQVLLQEPPEDPLALYLETLEALDIDPTKHDLRFEEWRWEARTLGAQGRGWHARIDGLGVTRLTVLEELAGHRLTPAALEISYGLERLLMAAMGSRDVFRLPWSEDIADGEQRRRHELQESRWAFELADTERLRSRLLDLEAEARVSIEHGLELRAYELAIECMPLVDVLAARDELLGKERSAWLDRIRRLVEASADLHLAGVAATAVDTQAGGGEDG